MSDVPEAPPPAGFTGTPRRWWQAAGGVWAILLGFAFYAAPRSCEWGLEAYTWLGIGLIPLALLLPFWTEAPTRGRNALGLAAMTLLIWCLGIVVADFQLLCRLF